MGEYIQPKALTDMAVVSKLEDLFVLSLSGHSHSHSCTQNLVTDSDSDT